MNVLEWEIIILSSLKREAKRIGNIIQEIMIIATAHSIE